MKLKAILHIGDETRTLKIKRLVLEIDTEGNQARERFTIYTSTARKSLMQLFDKKPTIEVIAESPEIQVKLCRGLIMEIGPSGYFDQTIIKCITESELERMYKIT